MADKILTPLKAIRAKCMDCCCGQAKEIKLCNLKTAPYTHTEWEKDRRLIKISMSVITKKKP
ncbi:hypothetical protein ACTQYZ_04545 [Anaerofustis sp. LCP19S3_F7]|uniref:hypothetical protein n=1 Tax=Anaerofustis sp. LCP19S3_F7 TaxID=3440247 RepID=UPI003F90232B